MFSWSQTSTKRQSSTSASNAHQYPGKRSSSRNGKSGVHTPLEGSIRPPTNGSELTRAQHLESYLKDPTLQRSTRKVSSDDTTYDTVFQTTQGDTLIVRVNIPLSSSFASFCPAMTLAGVRVRHPWVHSTNMRITGYDPIQSETKWKACGLTLGQAVHEVVQYLQLNPPEILEISDAGLAAIQPQTSKFRRDHGSSNNSKSPPRSSASNVSNGSSNGNYYRQHNLPPTYDATVQNQRRQAQLPPAPDVTLPKIPDNFDDVLDDKSREELEGLLNDEMEFLSLVHKLPVFGEIESITKTHLEENVKLANETLDKEQRLKSLHSEVQTLQDCLKTKVEEFRVLEREQNSLCATPDIKSTLRELNKAKKQAFDSSEAFAEEWVENGELDVDLFIRQFMEQRKVHHERAAKMEILQHQNTGGGYRVAT